MGIGNVVIVLGRRRTAWWAITGGAIAWTLGGGSLAAARRAGAAATARSSLGARLHEAFFQIANAVEEFVNRQEGRTLSKPDEQHF